VNTNNGEENDSGSDTMSSADLDEDRFDLTDTDDEEHRAGSASNTRDQGHYGGEGDDSSFSDDTSDDDEPAPWLKRGRGQPLWRAAKDETTGMTYYFHRHTRETSWTRPPDNETNLTAARCVHPTRRDGKPVLGAC
jgi:hypothetical protein